MTEYERGLCEGKQKGFNEACETILNYIDDRKKAYKANQLHQKYYAVDLLHSDITELFQCTWEFSGRKER